MTEQRTTNTSTLNVIGPRLRFKIQARRFLFM